MLSRAKRYNDTVCFCEQLVKKQPEDTVLLRPDYPLNSFEKDVSMLRRNYEHGYQMAIDHLDQIKALF